MIFFSPSEFVAMCNESISELHQKYNPVTLNVIGTYETVKAFVGCECQINFSSPHPRQLLELLVKRNFLEPETYILRDF